ncbi:hypothetical protein [Paraburkholderia solisilvae]|uniref:hypothetical protein n=1 Tax=Paraburkholderia solisilvae TaxID=624376 RepID=UPI0015834F6A|nr:hypothetical protein [Paraburkholderia solisilvae]
MGEAKLSETGRGVSFATLSQASVAEWTKYLPDPPHHTAYCSASVFHAHEMTDRLLSFTVTLRGSTTRLACAARVRNSHTMQQLANPPFRQRCIERSESNPASNNVRLRKREKTATGVKQEQKGTAVISGAAARRRGIAQ